MISVNFFFLVIKLPLKTIISRTQLLRSLLKRFCEFLFSRE